MNVWSRTFSPDTFNFGHFLKIQCKRMWADFLLLTTVMYGSSRKNQEALQT